MRHLYLIAVLAFASCSQKQENKISPKAVSQNGIAPYGNILVKEQFEKHYPAVKVYRDSISKQNFLTQSLKRLPCIVNKGLDDFYDDSFYYRQRAFVINDTLTLNIIEKQDSDSQYVHFYKGRPFNIINYTHGEVAPDAGYHFFLEDRDCWQLTQNKYLMAETPARWSGTILQFEFYQVVDFDKMEIIQFIDKRLK